MSDFSYESVQTHMAGGKIQVRNVTIKNGKGYKSVSRYCKGKCNSTVKRRLLLKDIEMIQRHQYIYAPHISQSPPLCFLSGSIVNFCAWCLALRLK